MKQVEYKIFYGLEERLHYTIPGHHCKRLEFWLVVAWYWPKLESFSVMTWYTVV